MKRACYLFVICVFGCTLISRAGETLSLESAVALAVQHSKEAQLARLKVEEAGWTATKARRERYPHITAYGVGGYYFRPLDLKIKEGSLTTTLDVVGNELGLGPLSALTGPFPSADLPLVNGSHTQWGGGISILQPITQQWRIGSGLLAAEAARTAARREADYVLGRLRFSVEQLYAGWLLEQARQTAAEARLAFVQRQLRDAQHAVQVGEALDDTTLGLRAGALEARTQVTRSRQQMARLALQLADLIGRPGVDDFQLEDRLPVRPQHPLAFWLARAAENPERQVAAALVEQARAGLRASRQTYIPELSAFASGFAQDGMPLAPETGGMVGLTLKWDVFDFGRRQADVARIRARHRAAELDRDRLEEQAARELRLAYQDFTYAGELIDLAQQAVAYRQRAAELARQATANDLALESKSLEATADLRQAQADLKGAHLQQHLALLKLYFVAGILSPTQP